MEVLAQTISYGHEYTVYSNDGVGQPYKVVRRNLRNGTEQTAFFANQELIDNLDDDDLDELLKCCEDRVFLSVLFKKHRENQKMGSDSKFASLTPGRSCLQSSS